MKLDILQILHEETTTQYNPDGKDKRVIESDEFDTVANQIDTMYKKHLIDFATWYSGMDKEKVLKAYDRFIKESNDLI